MKQFFTFFKLCSPSLGLRSSDVSLDRRLTVGSPSGLTAKCTLILCLLMTLGAGNAWGTDYTYRLVISKDDLTDGGKYILLVNNRSTAYNCTTNKSHFKVAGSFSSSATTSGSAVTTTAAASTIKYITLVNVSGNTYKMLDSDGKYMIATAAKSGSGSRADADSYGWTFTGTSGMVPIYQETGKKAHLRCNGATDFRTYANDDNGSVIYLATGCSIIYDGNGKTSGTVPTDAYLYGEGHSVTVKSNSGTLAKTGYTFSGWNTKADGSGDNYAAGSGSFTIPSGKTTITLYAKWTSTGSCTATPTIGDASLNGSFF